MEPFIRVDQYQYIKGQLKTIVNGYATANDENVIHILKNLVFERIMEQFTQMSEDRKQIFASVLQVKDKESMQKFISQVKPFVIPFKVSEQGIKKLFPKVKKLKIPPLEDLDFREISYLSWLDCHSNKKYIVFYRNGNLSGIEGTFQLANKKGICTICNKHELVGMFLVKEKGSILGTYKNRGNYICQDSQTCNGNLMNVDRLYNFVDTVTG